ncbi:hypothetical protein G8A07_10480 [Roseateles sp. DAIF2]|uniref:hypothetical protein n=1 Tax=Roseateles sp. DAIF2 TaxID=2714952 RepID=UPI0018A32A6D|nr:hypothetical protein [Roseateles sp. DAIF2]QPF73298.1 hypothetical protein G8A07_10480 [Roseateles sp. DAIF2]
MSQQPTRPAATPSLIGTLSERLRAASQALLPGRTAAIDGLEVSDSSLEEWDALCHEAEQRRHDEAAEAMLRAQDWRRKNAVRAWPPEPAKGS